MPATEQEKHDTLNKQVGHRDIAYHCAWCRSNSQARIVAHASYEDRTAGESGEICWCLCSCGQPTVLSLEGNPAVNVTQHPRAIEFTSGKGWPPDLTKLFDEAAHSFAGAAFTACAMVCRQMLMTIACDKGDSEGKRFVDYVDYIVANVVPIPSARASIDAIRTIGNEANHKIAFVQEADARRAIKIVQYVMNAAYSLPTA